MLIVDPHCSLFNLLVVRVADDSIIPAFWIAAGAFEFGEQVSPLTATQADALLVSGSKVSVLVCLSVCLPVYLPVWQSIAFGEQVPHLDAA